MKKSNFNGVITALTTPFKNDKIDLDTFEKIIYSQLKAKVHGLLLFGTTGEGLSLSATEKKILFTFAKKLVGNLPIICATSTTVTHEALTQVKEYQRWGADAVLVITPYYYKTSEDGVYEHFKTISQECELPIIIYNVPARTGYDLTQSPQLLNKISSLSNVCAIKHCANNLNDCLKISSHTKLNLLCGNDSLFFESVKNGYNGGICVFSNCLPAEATLLYDLAKNNDLPRNEILIDKINRFITAIDCQPNPIGIKYAVSRIFGGENQLRLPLTKANKNTKNKINEFLFEYKENL